MFIKIPDITIKTKRLILKSLKKADGAILKELLDDKEVCEPAGIGIDDVRYNFKHLFKDITCFNTALGIYLDDILMGYINFYPFHIDHEIYKDKHALMLGFVLGKQYWHKGYASEALDALTKYLLQMFDMCVCGHFEDNLASKRVIEKCGYRFLEAYDRDFPSLKETRRVLDYIHEK